MLDAVRASSSDVSTSASDDESCASSSSLLRGSSGVPVRLHVYDLGKSSAAVNRVWKDAGLGMFHTGVEVYGREWCFGNFVGIGYVKPTMDPCHQYRETIEMGETSLSARQVASKIAQLRREWTGDSYNLLTRNCHHFSEAFLNELGVAELPEWCNSLAGKPAGFANWFSSSDTDFDGGSAIWEAFGLPREEGSGQRGEIAESHRRAVSSPRYGIPGAAR